MLSHVKTMLRLSSIKGNIIMAIFVMGLFTFLLAVANYWLSQKLEENQQKHYQSVMPAQLAVESVKTAVHTASLHLQLFLQTGKSDHKAQWKKQWEAVAHQLNLLQKSEVATSETATTIQQLGQLLHLMQNSQQQALLDRQLEAEVMQKQLQELRQEANILQALLQEESVETKETHWFYLSFIRHTGLAFFVLCVVFGTALAYLLISQIFRSLYNIKLAVKGLSQGNLPQSVRESHNETSHILKELSNLIRNLRSVQHFAIRVGKGEFTNDINVFNNSGDLGTSLSGMRDSLMKVALEDKQRNWVNEGFARFGDLMRTHNNSISQLCDVVISQLVKYVGANQGAIFLKEELAKQEEVLKLHACYAYDRKKFVGKEILKGEGLCGQAWQENDILYINDVPDNYINIRSGLGGANPKAVLVVPLVSNEITQGVLELASFNQFEAYQIEFIRKIAENLASAIATTKNNEKTQQLLAEFRELTEELRAQEEEMRQNMEELQSTQEEMSRAQRLIQQKENNLNSVINNTSDTIFAIDRDYKITVVNQVLADKYRKMGIELQEGTRISDILPAKAWEIWKPRYDRALAGEQFSLIEESTGSHGSRFAQTYHNPIIDASGNIMGVSVISRDVTEMVKAQRENEQKRSTLKSLIDFTDDTYFAIDKEYKILIANKALKDRFASSNISLNEGENIFDKLPKEQHASWKERYDRALAGESFVMTTERQVKDKTLVIEVHHHPILDTEGQVIGATVISKDITRWQQSALEKEVQERELQKLKNLLNMHEPDKSQIGQGAANKQKTKSY